jgi:site-specific recombinase XerC
MDTQSAKCNPKQSPLKELENHHTHYHDRFIDDFAAHILAPSTLHSYRRLIRDHIKPEIGLIKLVNHRPDHLQTLYSAKLNNGLSPRTLQYIHSVIHRSLNQAAKSGLIYRNPTDAVTPP